MSKLSLVCVNIERSKHLDTVTPFLLERNPDVVCMQELCERDIPHFEQELGMRCIYAPLGRHSDEPSDPQNSVMIGESVFTRLPVVQRMIDYYSGSEEGARTTPMHQHMWNLPLITVDVEKEGDIFRIMTIHFTWTEKGVSDERQLRDLDSLFKILETRGEYVISGDFNAPRGRETFSRIAAKYTDNIPAHYQTSLDPKYHRAPLEDQADKMVDGIFSTPGYTVSNVELHNGISDHCAITAIIERS
ncbi:MAG TPA: endonuclease/exonuclease/phosphatase family protein [Candidatus Paceibacterota bacterium]|nr:endonuclease/exonuclease/phosphatase family protein [Candidatus Paceibacterota bacterium]